MKIYGPIATALLALPLIISCEKTPSTEPDPVEPLGVALTGSFESKWKRYSVDQRHEGQTDEERIQKEWKDTLWLGDRAHRQLMLWAKDKALSNVSVEVTDLSSGESMLPSSCISVRWSTYVIGDAAPALCRKATSRTSVKIADALSTTPETKVTAGDPLKLWLTANIPSDAVPGLYSGKVNVYKETKLLESFDISFLVVNHVLPDVSQWRYHLDIWQFPFQLTTLCKKDGKKITPFSDDYYKLVGPFYEVLADAGQKAITAYIKDGALNRGQTMVDWKLTTSGGWEFDYTKFDSFVQFMMDLGIDEQINCHSLYGWNIGFGYTDLNDGKEKRMSLELGDEQFEKIWSVFLLDFEKHLRAKGWFEKAVLYMDELPADDLAYLIDFIEANNPEWKINAVGNRYDESITEHLFMYVVALGGSRKSAAERTCYYVACEPLYPNSFVTKKNTLSEMNYFAWYALANDYEGFLRWAYDYWGNTDPKNAQDGDNAAGDKHFIYRSSNDFATCVPVSTPRLELLREGIQDYEKVMILGKDRFSSVLSQFTYQEHPKSDKLVGRAEALLKELSVTE